MQLSAVQRYSAQLSALSASQEKLNAAQRVKSFSSSHSARNGALTVHALRALSDNWRDFVEIVQPALLSVNIPRVFSSLAVRVSRSE